MPITPGLLTTLHQGIKDHPEFFYDLFVDPSFSNADADNEYKSTSYIRKFFAKNPAWVDGPLQLFMIDKVSRLAGAYTVVKHSDDDAKLPEDERPPLRQTAEADAFYDLRNIFQEILDEKTRQLKKLPPHKTNELNSRIDRVLSKQANNNFVDGFMWPILTDLISPKGKRIIDRYLAKKQLRSPASTTTTEAILPGNLLAPTSNDLAATINLVNGIYAGHLGMGLPETPYTNEQLYGRVTIALEQALGLNPSLLPASENFIVDHVYSAMVRDIAMKMTLLDEDETSHDDIIDSFNNMSSSTSRDHQKMLEQIIHNIKESIKKSEYGTSFVVGEFHIGFSAGDSKGKREYFLKAGNEITEIDAVTAYMLISEYLSAILSKQQHRDISQELASMLPHLPTILAIAHYGSYATPLINGVSRAATDDLSVFASYDAIEAATPKKPDNYAVLSTAQSKIYDILGNQVTAAAEQALAYKFAKFAVQGTESTVSPKIVNKFKGEKSQHKRVQYLVLEMLRNNTKPHSMANTKSPELNQAIDLYRSLEMEANNIQVTPSKNEVAEINSRVSKGEITDHDLKTLMRNVPEEKIAKAITPLREAQRTSTKFLKLPSRPKSLEKIIQRMSTKKPNRPN